MGDWSASTKVDLTVVTPPSIYLPSSGPTIFLAGSMCLTDNHHWRDNAVSIIRSLWFEKVEYDITVFNPRRDGWCDDFEREQTAWNIHHLEAADFIIVHLIENSGLSSESLLEIGMYMSNKKTYISIEPNHPKRTILEIHIAKYGSSLLQSTFIDSIRNIKNEWEKKYE